MSLMQVTPFQIAVPEPELDALKTRLALTRWPDRFDAPPWALGTDLDYLRELVDYWATAYDWRAAEARLNREPQFTAQIGDSRIHFLHRRGVGPKPYPLVITHGWPGSFME